MKYLSIDFRNTSTQLSNMLLTLIIHIPIPIQISKKHNHYTQTTFRHKKINKKNPRSNFSSLKEKILWKTQHLTSDLNIQNGIRKISRNEKTSMPTITASFIYISTQISPPLPLSNSHRIPVVEHVRDGTSQTLSKVWISKELPLWDARRETDIPREIKCYIISLANKLLITKLTNNSKISWSPFWC